PINEAPDCTQPSLTPATICSMTAGLFLPLQYSQVKITVLHLERRYHSHTSQLNRFRLYRASLVQKLTLILSLPHLFLKQVLVLYNSMLISQTSRQTHLIRLILQDESF